ncbi:HAMP domain-containing histidine kinase [Tissierella creatinini]|nr:HAMP domain-containing histidine kinase [Tissierella creatinini]TJX63076.1 HAMP domain-containing histidine kinase [Soehngenia saccharolytica]
MGYNPESIIVSEYKSSRTAFKYEMNNAFHETLGLIQWQGDEDVEVNTSATPFKDSVANQVGDGVLEEETEVEAQEPSEVIAEEEVNVPQGIQIVNEDKDYIFYVSDGVNTFTNKESYTREDFAKHEDTFLAFEKGNVSYGKKVDPSIISWYSAEDDVTLYLAFTDDFMNEQQKGWEAGRDVLVPMVKLFVAFIILAIILIIYLTIVTGRLPYDDELHFNWVDKIWTEFMVGAFILTIIGWFYGVYTLGVYSFRSLNTPINNLTSTQSNAIYLIGVITAVAVLLCGVIYLALIRKIKGKRFIKDCLTYKFFYRIFHGVLDFLKSFFDGRRFEKFPLTKSLHKRQIAFIVASFILVFLTFIFIAVPPLMIFPPILEIVIILWYVKYNNKTYEEINKGFDESLEEQMKSERMKINLVTNVSHDLKTPLTSIISYVDLLSKEDDLSETARDYVNILREKSNRLKNIVADLFDLAKSTSGDINVDFEDLDLKKLIEQTLGDMEDDIEKSGLTIKTNLPNEPVMIKSDGKKLYRVFQNIIDNALKYSLKGTRIFVELEDKDGKAIATVKNTAGYEMDFTAEEILQRFNRGDESRTTEGSGLGLSIAESFTEVSGGSFKVDIDGDMFKVIIEFQ